MSDSHIESPESVAVNTSESDGTFGSPSSTFDAEPQGWGGLLSFGGTMAILIGVLHAVSGFTALFKDEYLVVPQERLVISVDYSVWAWTHLVLGALAIATGYGIIKRQRWARYVGVVIAGLSILANLGFIDAKPVWSVMVIAFDVLLIFALTMHGDAPQGPKVRPRWSSPSGPMN